MPYRLINLMLNRVDLVPDGANPDAAIMLFKSKEGGMPKAKAKPVKKTGVEDTRKKRVAKGDEEDDEEEEESTRRMAKSDDEEDDEELVEDDDAETEDEDDDEVGKAKSKAKVKAKKSAKKAPKKVAKQVDDVDDEEEEDEDEEDDDLLKALDDDEEEEEEEEIPESVLKAAPKGVREAFTKMTARLSKLAKRVQDAEAVANVEKDKRITTEFVAKAKKELPNLPGTAEEKGEVLKALTLKLDKSIVKSIFKLLKAGDAALHSLLMAEHGSGQPDLSDGSAYSQLVTLRDEAMEKDDKLDKHSAMARVCKAHPDLHRRYRVERQTRRVVEDVN